MFRYIIRRLLQAIPTLFGISIISFILVGFVPGDPILVRTFDPKIKEEVRETLRQQLGLDQPLPLQYVRWMSGFSFRSGDVAEKLTYGNTTCTYSATFNLTICDSGGGILRGDLGTSFDSKEPVWDVLGNTIPATLLLGICSLFLSFLIGVPLGVASAAYHRSKFDYVIRTITAVLQSVPPFYTAFALILIFAIIWKVLPVAGMKTISLDDSFDLADRIRYLILPSFALALGPAAAICRLTRTEVLEVVANDYVRTARAKGLGPRTVWISHTLRNSLIPLMTILGPAIVGVLGGAVVTETIFAWNGTGRMTVTALGQRDFPIVLGTGMFFAVLTIIGNLLSDIFYAVVDPRVRLS